MTADLITIETLKPADVFKPGAVEKLISDVEAKVRAIPAADHTTEKGRNEIKALAYKVTRSKTALDDMGKTFVAELKKAAGVVDADRRIIRERLDALKDEVRKPVDEYEAADAKRIAEHTAQMEYLQAIDTFLEGSPISTIDQRLEHLKQLRTRNWEEFTDGANRLIAKMEASLFHLRDAAVKREEERIELERLRKAEAERQEAERKASAAREQRERDQRIASEAAAAATARAEKAERDAKAATERAEFETARTMEKAEGLLAVAVEAERKRVADAKAAEDEASRKREANRSWRANVKKKAVAALVEAGLSAKYAELAFNAIDRGEVPGVSIQY